MAQIRIPPVLRPDAGGRRSVDIDAETVADALHALVVAHPALDGRVLAGDELPAFLNVFVDGEDVRLRDGLATPVQPGSTILLLPAVAGGEDPWKTAGIAASLESMRSAAKMSPLFAVIACAQLA
jgi:adenylyltransferase/sulfurtransferase